MMNKKMAFAALGLGAAYLMRNKDARDKLSKQFDSFGTTPMKGEKGSKTSTSTSTVRNKGLLGGLFS